MSTPDQIERRQQDRQIEMLETLRKLRREKAEAEVARSREEESERRAERTAAAVARADASTRLEQWNLGMTMDAYLERIRKNSALSQPIFEFDELNSELRRRQFAELAAHRRESLASEKLAAVIALAKVAAVSHEKIVECRK